ncbi:hypothetical protein BXY39_3286 [Eilatimonas milleporae]|uniref:Uncharacterized protein n=1 Tax=Eilatimonas milleporae TaxID=911205 RepID=A0A3M0C3F6_9PROT|nr:hypothetical protein BXY39_3286 [Eilatimonas milleporae]
MAICRERKPNPGQAALAEAIARQSVVSVKIGHRKDLSNPASQAALLHAGSVML